MNYEFRYNALSTKEIAQFYYFLRRQDEDI